MSPSFAVAGAHGELQGTRMGFMKILFLSYLSLMRGAYFDHGYGRPLRTQYEGCRS